VFLEDSPRLPSTRRSAPSVPVASIVPDSLEALLGLNVKRGGRFRQRLQLQGDVEPTNAATREQLRNTSDKGAVETSNLDESFFRADECYVGGN
jgi:hypothetical protein